MRVIALLTILLLPLMAHSASIYLCRAYDGGTFWSSAHCNQHKALIERIANVPEGMSFDLQVNIAQQQRTQKTEPMRLICLTLSNLSFSIGIAKFKEKNFSGVFFGDSFLGCCCYVLIFDFI